MNTNDNRSFRGVWIPRWLYLNRDLSWVEKLLVLEVYSLDRGDGCFASNEYLSNFLGVSVGTIANAIGKLKANGFLSINGDGNDRRLCVVGEAGAAFEEKPPTFMSQELSIPNQVLDCGLGGDEEIEIGANGETIGDGETEVKAGKEHIDTIKISKNKQQQVEIVYDFWNSFGDNQGWRKHTKISYDIMMAVKEAVEHYSVEDVCGAITNYAKVLLDDRYYWNHVWSLSVFLTVKHGVSKDSPRKWYQFLENNFVESNYLRVKPDIQKDDQHPELTIRIIRLYGRLTNNPEYTPDQLRMNKFIEASEKMSAFFGKRKIPKETWMKLFSNCLEEVYINKGQLIYPGNLCSDTMWESIMPQFIAELGV